MFPTLTFENTISPRTRCETNRKIFPSKKLCHSIHNFSACMCLYSPETICIRCGSSSSAGVGITSIFCPSSSRCAFKFKRSRLPPWSANVNLYPRHCVRPPCRRPHAQMSGLTPCRDVASQIYRCCNERVYTETVIFCGWEVTAGNSLRLLVRIKRYRTQANATFSIKVK